VVVPRRGERAAPLGDRLGAAAEVLTATGFSTMR